MYPRYTVPLCPAWAQSRRKSSLHPILLVCDLTLLRARCEWGRREQCERSSWDGKYPGRQHSFTASTRDMGTHSLTPSCIAMEPETNTGSGTEQERSLEPSSLLCESLGHTFFCAFFFSLAEAAPWGWLQLLPNFWGKVPSAYGKESIWPTVFISQPGFFLAWQITHCLLRSNTSAKLEFLKVKDLIYHSTEKKKDLKNTFKCEKIPFVYAQTKQPGGSLTKFQLELKKKKKPSAVIHRRLQAASARRELEPGSSKYLNKQWAPWGPRW